MLLRSLLFVFKSFLLIKLATFTLLSVASNSEKVIANIGNEAISLATIVKGNELEIYKAEQSLYELQMAGLRNVLISKLIRKDPRSNGLSENDYLTQFVVNPAPVTDEQVDRFIKLRRIPQEKINTNLKEQARRFLVSQQLASQIDSWLEVQKNKHHVQISLAVPEEPRFEIDIENVAYRGGKNAEVTLVEYSDFECPYCVKVNKTLAELGKIYGDKIKVVYKQFPLSSIHPKAEKAAQASLCAQEQGMENFWLMHDKMFSNQRNLSVGVIKDMAASLGLKTELFNQCLTSNKYAARVAADVKEGMSLGVNSTPAFFINGRFNKGALPLESFQKIIDEELALSNRER